METRPSSFFIGGNCSH